MAMEIDDSLYSRQRYMLGDGAMKSIMESKVLLIGCGGTGVEIAKNLVLAGVKQLSILDNKNATIEDVGSNFYISENDVKLQKSRSEICVPKLADLNPYVKVCQQNCAQQSASAILESGGFSCVVMTDSSLDDQLAMNESCRKCSPCVKFVSCDVLGGFASLVCDFGDKFLVLDTDGEKSKEIYVSSISQGNPGLVICTDDQPHGFNNGDEVMFSQIEGMTELNGTLQTVKVISRHGFTIGDTTLMGKYIRNGVVKLPKRTKNIKFRPFNEQLVNPEFMETDFGNPCTSVLCHVTLLALDSFKKQFGSLPSKWSVRDLEELAYFVKQQPNGENLSDEDLAIVKRLALGARGCLAPLCSAVGGFAAQEVLKAITGKYTPLQQWLYINAYSLLAPDADQEAPDSKGRYASLARCLGGHLQEGLRDVNVFMVGCGAIGCEMLKNLALLGIATDSGKLTITDNDVIEKSNLNRQFLFRNHHIQKAKSLVAASACKDISPDLKVDALQLLVNHTTEESDFTDDFFSRQNVVVNALDNNEARRYVDRRCVSNCRALVESGTSGPKGHVQVVVPHLTESYGCQHDPADEQIAFCTLRMFPSKFEHVVQWSKEKFAKVFTVLPDGFNRTMEVYRTEAPEGSDVFEYLANNMEKVSNYIDSFVRSLRLWPQSWSDCVARARCSFEKYFNIKPRRLLHSRPLDCVKEDGSLFWSLPRRPPKAVDFDRDCQQHMEFVLSYAKLFARIYGLELPDGDEFEAGIEMGIRNADLPKFTPHDSADVDALFSEERAPAHNCTTTPTELTRLKGALAGRLPPLNDATMLPQDFEKDDDANGHVDYLAALSNLRAAMYMLPQCDRLETKRIAGNIVPAIATTTSIVAGLAALQLLQVLKDASVPPSPPGSRFEPQTSRFRNTFLNCALPFLLFSEPAEAKREKVRDGVTYTIWDSWDVVGSDSFTLQDFIDHLKNERDVTVSGVSCGSKLIYFSFLPVHKKRLTQRMNSLIEVPKCGYVELAVMVEGESDPPGGNSDPDDVSTPNIRYYFSPR